MKKWDVVAAGQYLRGGKHMAVGWGKYGEAEHGEEILDGFETSSSDSDEISIGTWKLTNSLNWHLMKLRNRCKCLRIRQM